MIHRLIYILILTVAAGLSAAQNRAYCNITSITTQQLSNGVQVTIKADGVLDFERYGSYGSTRKTSIYFTNAKSKIGKNYIDVSKYPLSYIQVSVPQTAIDGIGVEVVAAMFEDVVVNIEASNDRQSVIITVNSDRTLVGRTEKGGGASGTAIKKTSGVEFKDGLVILHAVKANLAELLGNLGHESQTNIAVDDSVKDREVSLSLDGLNVDEALQAIASSCGLAMEKVGDTYSICDGNPTDLATYRLSKTESFRMRNIKAQEASGLLPTFLYSFLHVNEAQNAVVVTAAAQMLDKIRRDFEKIDLAPPQIMVEALAVEVASTGDLNASLSLLGINEGTTAKSDSATGDISYSTVGSLPADFQAKLSALVSSGKAEVKAAPRMAAVNGKYANLFIGETRFIKVEVNSYGGKYERIQGVDVGVKLNVRPWTGGNGEITVSLEPEVSNISEIDRVTRMPVLSTRRAMTTVRVKDGETIVIGGLTQKQDYVTHTRIPFFGDLPLIGTLFQSRKTSSVNSELVIFITPHILTDRGWLKDEKKEQEIRDRFQGKEATGR